MHSTYLCSYISFIVYIITGIYYLVQSYTFVHECRASSLWEYNLLSLFVGFVILLNYFIRRNDTDNMIILCYNTTPVIALFIWGFVVNVCTPCNFLINSPIYAYSQTVWVVQLLFLFTVIGWWCNCFLREEYNEIN